MGTDAIDPVASAELWLATVAGATEMGRSVAGFDWSTNPLGPLSTWSPALRSAVGLCLSSRFPMIVLWGNELIGIYNDGMRPILGSQKHPGGLGAPARTVWAEIWEVVGPLFASVLGTGSPTWGEDRRLVLERNGFPEECYFTYSYSPIFADDATVRGVFVTATETTRSVVAQRRLARVARLSRSLLSAEDPTEVCVAAAKSLTSDIDGILAADVFLRAGEPLTLVASNRRVAVAATSPKALLNVISTRLPMRVDGPSDDESSPAQIALPLGSPGDGPDGVLVATLNPQRLLDEPFEEFLALVARTITRALDSAYQQSTALGTYRNISDTLQASMLTPAIDLPTVAARYLPAVAGLAVGGDWYDVMDVDPGRRGLIVGDCVGHGLAAATAMAQLRVAARTLLLEGHDPALTLTKLDFFAASVDGAYCASMLCAIFDAHTHVLTYSRAGHPPALVVSDGEPVWLDGATGPPLCVDLGQSRTNATCLTNDGDLLVMYSDGLIERRTESIANGFDRLARAAVDLHRESVQRIADGLLTRLQPENTRDDVVLVVKRLTTKGREPAPVFRR